MWLPPFSLQFKRANLINVDNAMGLMLHYSLSVERNNLMIFLLRDATNALESGVELVDDIDDAIICDEPVVNIHHYQHNHIDSEHHDHHNHNKNNQTCFAECIWACAA